MRAQFINEPLGKGDISAARDASDYKYFRNYRLSNWSLVLHGFDVPSLRHNEISAMVYHIHDGSNNRNQFVHSNYDLHAMSQCEDALGSCQ